MKKLAFQPFNVTGYYLAVAAWLAFTLPPTAHAASKARRQASMKESVQPTLVPPVEVTPVLPTVVKKPVVPAHISSIHFEDGFPESIDDLKKKPLFCFNATSITKPNDKHYQMGIFSSADIDGAISHYRVVTRNGEVNCALLTNANIDQNWGIFIQGNCQLKIDKILLPIKRTEDSKYHIGDQVTKRSDGKIHKGIITSIFEPAGSDGEVILICWHAMGRLKLSKANQFYTLQDRAESKIGTDDELTVVKPENDEVPLLAQDSSLQLSIDQPPTYYPETPKNEVDLQDFPQVPTRPLDEGIRPALCVIEI